MFSKFKTVIPTLFLLLGSILGVVSAPKPAAAQLNYCTIANYYRNPDNLRVGQIGNCSSTGYPACSTLPYSAVFRNPYPNYSTGYKKYGCFFTRGG